MTRLHLDLETHSTLDLRKVGSSRYFQDPATDITCLCWVVDDDVVIGSWLPVSGTEPPDELLLAVARGYEIHAWGAKFERDAWLHVLEPRWGISCPALDKWHCTMARANYWGLPHKLELAGPALGVPFDKLKYATARALMLQMARPRGYHARGHPIWWHDTDQTKLATLVDYCAQDVEAERAVHLGTAELPERERQIWLADQRMNGYGIAVDRVLGVELCSIAQAAKFDIDRELSSLTCGKVTSINQVGKLLPYVQAHGLPDLPDLRKDTIEDWADPTGSLAEQALALRRDGAKTSVAKLDMLLAAVEPDGRLRGSLRYYGALRTGRWAGSGGARVQLHNLPRGVIVDPLMACQDIIDGMPPDFLRKFHGRLLDVVSSCLRGCFIAGAGKALVVGDFSQIEARILAWLAGQLDVLDVFRRGEDVYAYDALNLGSDNRQLGKTFRLGAGYGTGANKMLAIAKGYGVALSLAEAVQHIGTWRSRNLRIVELWYALERAFRLFASPTVRPGSWQVVNGFIDICKSHGGVALVLPSKRWLVYRNARVEIDPDSGEHHLLYDSLDHYTNQWGAIRTWGSKLAADVTQATARDVMAESILTIEDKLPELHLALSVHDELIGETDEAYAETMLEYLEQVMSTAPAWAPGLPVAAKGWYGPRYHKA